ncbi:hypothetical protein ACFX13_038304 [Malus domestica]
MHHRPEFTLDLLELAYQIVQRAPPSRRDAKGVEEDVELVPISILGVGKLNGEAVVVGIVLGEKKTEEVGDKVGVVVVEEEEGFRDLNDVVQSTIKFGDYYKLLKLGDELMSKF